MIERLKKARDAGRNEVSAASPPFGAPTFGTGGTNGNVFGNPRADKPAIGGTGFAFGHKDKDQDKKQVRFGGRVSEHSANSAPDGLDNDKSFGG